MGSYHSIRNPPKYYCQGCGRGFRRRKQHNDHILLSNRFGQPRCKAMRKQNNSKTKVTIQQQVVEPELVSLKDEIVHYDPQTTKYYGRPYSYYTIPIARNTSSQDKCPRCNGAMIKRQVNGNTMIEYTWSEESKQYKHLNRELNREDLGDFTKDADIKYWCSSCNDNATYRTLATGNRHLRTGIPLPRISSYRRAAI